ncbi:hypothetical protein ILUMI_08382 [Ignelater luminosus]|uniref:Medium-chain acyl-CoA ligase ACSF2, mitochondrial n=1 Tax=Ignelater luminosus TaxID=2038154 RepID=A0A8K0GAP8_IGNLU|nr:hypothetical protein ILUMI_08382 [Ignelater luminosus]
MMFYVKVLNRSVFNNVKSIRSLRKYSKLSYIHHIGKEPLRSLTLGKVYENTANKYPEREAIISLEQRKRLNYQEFLEQADKLAAGLLAIGLENGDRVGLWAPNLIEWQIINIACARVGLIVVALNPAYQASELEYCINKVGMKAIVCPDKIKKVNFYEILNQVSEEVQKCDPGKLKCKKVPSLKSVILISNEAVKGTYNYNEILDLGDENSTRRIKENQDKIQADSAVNIQFTSGTTGKPKAAILTHFNVVNNSFAIGKRNELDKKHHKICVQVPFFHAFGYTITFGAAINFGASLVIPSSFYSPSENLRAAKEEKCTIIHGTPTMYVDLVNMQKQKQESINPEIAVSGGSPCSPQLFRQMKDILKVKKVKSVYGLTETTAVCFHSLPVDEDENKATETVGHLSDHLEAKVVDAKGCIVPFGTPGELYVRGYTTMLGYWDDEKKTKETITDDHWLQTGDQFILQEDGYGKIVGRLKDMIIRGGENIYPKEIEDFLNTHPDILETQVIGLPHERLGEEVCACIRIRENSKLTKESLMEFCKGKIAHFKIPSQLEIVDNFPKTQSGKVQKHLLRKQFEKQK